MTRIKIGKCKWFNEKKGFGFITGDDEVDYFVHYSAIQGRGFKTLVEAEPVEFQVEETEKGLQAINVNIIE